MITAKIKFEISSLSFLLLLYSILCIPHYVYVYVNITYSVIIKCESIIRVSSYVPRESSSAIVSRVIFRFAKSILSTSHGKRIVWFSNSLLFRRYTTKLIFG